MASAKLLTKKMLVEALAQKTGAPKSAAEEFLGALAAITQEQLGSSGPGSVTIPGLVKLKAVDKPATPARNGVNPFTKQPIKIAAKPASRKVRASVVKQLKDAVSLGFDSTTP